MAETAVEENKAVAATTPAAGEQAKPAAKAEAAPDKKAEPQQAGGKKAEAAPENKKAEPHALKDDDEVPEDAELVTLSSTALKKRLQRATSAELKERFGTADVDSIKKKLARADELEKAEEDRRVAALDKEQKAAEKLKAAEERADKAEARARETRDERVVEKEEGRLQGLVGEHLKPKYWKHVSRDLAEHLRDTYSKKELAKLGDKAITKWAEGYAKENPEYAKDAPAGDDKKDVKKVALDNGAKDEARPSNAGGPNLAQKTFKPGQPNSMTAQEARAAASREGFRW